MAKVSRNKTCFADNEGEVGDNGGLEVGGSKAEPWWALVVHDKTVLTFKG